MIALDFFFITEMKNEQLPPPNSLPGDWIPLRCHLRRGTGSSTEQETSYTEEEPVPLRKNSEKTVTWCTVHVLRAGESPGPCLECRTIEWLMLGNPSNTICTAKPSTNHVPKRHIF